MKYLIFFLMLPILSKSQTSSLYGGTTILVFLNKDTAWMAADSRRGIVGSNMFDTICKIVHVNEYVGAVEGDFSGYKMANGELLYDARLVMREAMSKGKDKQEVTQIITDTLYKNIKQTLTIENKNLAFFQSVLNKKRILEVVLVSIVKGESHLMTISFSINGTIDKWDLNSVYREGSYKVVEFYSTGYRDSIESYLNKNKDFWINNKRAVETKLRDLINIEAANNPAHVGIPVDVIGLTANGIKWFTPESKGRCY